MGGADLHTALPAKATALGFSLVLNRAFVDSNERVAHAAMEVLLTPNGYEIVATVMDRSGSRSIWPPAR